MSDDDRTPPGGAVTPAPDAPASGSGTASAGAPADPGGGAPADGADPAGGEPTPEKAVELPAGPRPPLRSLVEGLLFATDAPLTLAKMREILDAEGADVRAAIDELAAEYDAQGRAFGVQAIGGGWALSTRTEVGPWVARLKKSRDEGRLSPAALETLSIIAYRQPINRVNIEAIRGVQSGALIRALMDRDLVRVAGKEELPGHPVLYGTTPRFLELLGLNSLSDLPKPEDLK